MISSRVTIVEQPSQVGALSRSPVRHDVDAKGVENADDGPTNTPPGRRVCKSQSEQRDLDASLAVHPPHGVLDQLCCAVEAQFRLDTVTIGFDRLNRHFQPRCDVGCADTSAR